MERLPDYTKGGPVPATPTSLAHVPGRFVQLVLRVLHAIGHGLLLLHGAYKAFMHRHFENVGLLGGLAVVVAVSYGLFRLDPSSPSLSPATVQVLVAAPVLLLLECHTAIYVYKHLLPAPFRALVGQLGERLTADVLPPLNELLATTNPGSFEENLKVAAFKVKYHLLKFTLRCVRYCLFSVPFAFIFLAMERQLHLVLTMQPH